MSYFLFNPQKHISLSDKIEKPLNIKLISIKRYLPVLFGPNHRNSELGPKFYDFRLCRQFLQPRREHI